MTTYQVICLLTWFSCTCIYTPVSEIDIIDNGIKAIKAMELLKPVYMRNGDLQSDRNNVITDYELSIAVSNTIKDLKCVQRDRDLWRLYVGSSESRAKLLTEGFELRIINVQTFDTNPFSAGTRHPAERVIKVTVKGVPLSVDDNEIVKMLESFNVTFSSGIKYENIRHPETRKMTGVLNGNRFVYIKPMEEGRFLPRTSYCAGLRCFIYHYGQPSYKRVPLCTNCWDNTHYKNECTNESRCKACKKPGHKPGEQACEHFVDEQPQVITFSGKNNTLSNFYSCDLNIFGLHHKSAEHAFQYVKAMRSGDVPRATAIQSATTALDAKKLGNQVKPSDSFLAEQVTLMSEIVEAKATQCSEFRDSLRNSKKSTVFAESTFDDFWASGLNEKETQCTNSDKWPGKNTLGDIIMKVAKHHRPKSRSWLTARASKPKDNTQRDIADMLKQLKTPRKRNISGHRKDSPRDSNRGSCDESSGSSVESE